MSKSTKVTLQRFVLVSALLLLGACVSTTPVPQQQASADQPDAEVNPYLSLADAKRQYKPQALKRSEQKQLKQAASLVKQQDWAGAKSAISKLLSDPEVNTRALILAGDIARQEAGESTDNQPLLDKAVGYYSQVIAREPRNYYAHNRLAGIYRHTGEFERALQHYEAAISSWPGFALAYRNRGILNDLYLGNKAAALEDYQTYLGLIELAQGRNHRQVKGWIADLSRQLDSQLANTGANHGQ